MSEAIPPEIAAEVPDATSAVERPVAVEVTIESPPPAARPETHDEADPRAALNRLAAALTQQRSTQLLLEYLRLRRIARSMS